MDRRKQIVRDAYDRIGGRYLEWSLHSRVRQRQLEALLGLLSPGAEVLELGCGAGAPVTVALAARGPVTAVDISPAQTALAATNAPGANVVCADIAALTFAEGAFDAVCSFYALTHIPRDTHAALFRRIARWLRPGGLFFATLGALDHPDGETGDWLGAPNFFSHFDAETNVRLLERSGFRVESAERILQDLPGEEGLDFLWAVARKGDA
ncbi:MAG TPA: class I SAM-dependent methyltransferase [Rhizomicrobium sp.]|nr:class I SAM-dependent methyltransferase [Rhizomicrobium sp.]